MIKSNYIIFSKNNNNGTTIKMKCILQADVSNNYYNILFNYNKEYLKNRIIISSKVETYINERYEYYNICYLTQQNLNHNMNYIYKNNNLNNPYLIFKKYSVTNNIINNNISLFNFNNIQNPLTNVNIYNNNYNLYNYENDIIFPSTNNTLNNLIIYLNYYKNFNSSEYYNFKFTDFISNDYNCNYIEPLSISLINNFSNDNTINYNENIFNKLLYYNNNNISNNIISKLNILNLNNTIIQPNINDNILIYNKLNNMTKIKISYKDNNSNDIAGYSNINLYFSIIKGYELYNNLNYKLLLNKNYTFLNSIVLDSSSNFYNSSNSSNLYFKNQNNNGIIYLSLGNGICGITQKDILNNINISTITNNNNLILQTSKITIGSNINSNIITNNYLLDSSYNYDYINIINNNIQQTIYKFTDISLNNYYNILGENKTDIFNNNTYKERFKTLELLNTINNINDNYYYTNYNINSNIFYATYINYDNNYKLNINSGNFKLNQPIIYNSNNNIIDYDYRFNYGKNFYVDMHLNINYSLLLNEYINIDNYYNNLIIDSNNRLLLNFNKIILTTYFLIAPAEIFTGVNCVYIYHDPLTDPNPIYRFPNNNIEYISNPLVDTLNKSIEVLPNAANQFTNSVFIPSQNGSNLSKKRIIGLLGLNKIPSLLSIKPFDPNYIEGRGFTSQFNVNNACPTYKDKINNKLNAIKNSSVKNINGISQNQNFANLVRSNVLSSNVLNIQQCINPTIDYSAPVYTPFKLFKTGRGEYLNP